MNKIIDILLMIFGILSFIFTMAVYPHLTIWETWLLGLGAICEIAAGIILLSSKHVCTTEKYNDK